MYRIIVFLYYRLVSVLLVSGDVCLHDVGGWVAQQMKYKFHFFSFLKGKVWGKIIVIPRGYGNKLKDDTME